MSSSEQKPGPAALRTLTELVRNVASAPDEEGVRTAVSAALKDAFGYERIAIFLAGPDGGLALSTLAGSFPAEVRPGVAIPPREGLVGLAFDSETSLLSDDTGGDERYREVPGLPCRSEVAIPVTVDGERVGVLDVQSERPAAFSAEDVDVLESVADLLGVAIARVRLLESLEKRSRDAEEATARWRESMETKDRYLSAVSHEFRTPLTSIRSFAEILLTHGSEDPETTREFLSIIHDEAVRLTRLVNDLLDFSKMKAGRMAWEFAPNSLSEAVRRAAASVASIAAQKRVEIEVLEESPVGLLLFDLDRVIQVLVNVLANAVKFSPKGEKVSLILRPRDGGAQVVVRDRGPGIEPADRMRIFDRFEQGGGASGHPGTGLGLSISREIVVAHGGTIWADSAPDGGGEIAFVLPAAARLARA